MLLPLLLLAGLASVAGVAAVLPAYLLGLAMSRSLNERKEAWSKVRTVFLGFMVSLFFLAAGSNVSMEALLAGALFIIALGFGRVLLKMVFVLPARERVHAQGPHLHSPANVHLPDLRHGLPAVRVRAGSHRHDAILNIGGDNNHRGIGPHVGGPEVVRSMEGKQLRLLVAVDGSVHGEKALRKAALLALSRPLLRDSRGLRRGGPRVRLPDGRGRYRGDGGTGKEGAAGLPGDLDVGGRDRLIALLHGPPVTKILEFAESFHPDLIVTGSRGMGATKGALIGSVSSSLSKRANTSVLIVR